MQRRIGNILVTTLWSLLLLVWLPTLLVGGAATTEIEEWTLTLGTAYTECENGRDTSESIFSTDCLFGDITGTFDTDGILLWLVLTFVVLAIKYLITGSIRLKFMPKSVESNAVKVT